jgi:hypothetical protein
MNREWTAIAKKKTSKQIFMQRKLLGIKSGGS